LTYKPDIPEKVIPKGAVQSLANQSRHLYKSEGVSSQVTRNRAEEIVCRQNEISTGVNYKRHSSKKHIKLLSLVPQHLPTPKVIPIVLPSARKKGNKVATFFSGREDGKLFSSTLVKPFLPEGVHEYRVFSAPIDLTPYPVESNATNLPGHFILVPRCTLLERYKNWDMSQTFESLLKICNKEKILSDCKITMSRILQFDPLTRRSYPCFGHGTLQGGRGHTERGKNLMGVDEEKEDLHQLCTMINVVAAEFCETCDLTMTAMVKKLVGYDDKEHVNLLHPTVTFACNNFVSCHMDEDYTLCYLSVVANNKLPLSVHANWNKVDPILLYFCFPELGYSVPLRNGDILIFDSTLKHCASSRCDFQTDVITVAQYCSTSVVSNNDNTQDVQQLLLQDKATLLSPSVTSNKNQKRRRKSGTPW
jgi:hypothetical protein